MLIRWIFVFLLLLFMTSCGPSPGTFQDVYTNTFKKSCMECHVPTGSATVDYHAKLDFSTSDLAYQTLTTSTVSGITSSTICAGVKIVAANDPTNSYLMGVLFRDYYKTDFGGKSGCTPNNVHLESINVTDTEKSSIQTWINAGALNN